MRFAAAGQALDHCRADQVAFHVDGGTEGVQRTLDQQQQGNGVNGPKDVKPTPSRCNNRLTIKNWTN